MVTVIRTGHVCVQEVRRDQLIYTSVESETSILHQLQAFYFHESSTASYLSVVPTFLTTQLLKYNLKKSGNVQIFFMWSYFHIE